MLYGIGLFFLGVLIFVADFFLNFNMDLIWTWMNLEGRTMFFL